VDTVQLNSVLPFDTAELKLPGVADTLESKTHDPCEDVSNSVVHRHLRVHDIVDAKVCWLYDKEPSSENETKSVG
jgi:hypothetical protein